MKPTIVPDHTPKQNKKGFEPKATFSVSMRCRFSTFYNLQQLRPHTADRENKLQPTDDFSSPVAAAGIHGSN